MGKSFLIERIRDYAKQQNYRTVNLDLSLLLLQDYKSDLKEEFLYRFCSTEAGIYNNHLRELLEIIKNKEELAEAMKTVIEAKEAVLLNSIIAFKLKSLGLVHLEGNNVKPSNKLYSLYFQTHLSEEKLGD